KDDEIILAIVLRKRWLPSFEHVALCWLLGCVDQVTVGLHSRRGGDVRFFYMVGSENVKHLLPCRQQVVGDDASVTAPPHGFRAHDRAAPRMPELAQMREPVTKIIAEGVVGIVMKTVVFPE